MEKSTSKRFYLRHTLVPKDIEVGHSYELDQREEGIFFQLTKVFRTNVGQEIILLNQKNDNAVRQNTEFHFTTALVSKKSIQLKLTGKSTIDSSLKQSLALGLCLPNKPAKLDFILEKATELGVSQFYLLKSDLSQFSHELRLDRLEKIVTEAAEQSEQVAIPQITVIKNVEEYLNLPIPNSFVALEREGTGNSILDIKSPDDLSGVLIGPEGGFSDREVAFFKSKNSATINLGGNILKMDTAALLAVGILSLKLQQ